VRRHELDVFSLVTGLVFVAVAAGHLLDESSQMDFDGRWVVPLVMVAIGVAGLAGLVRGRETRPADAATAGVSSGRPAGNDAAEDAGGTQDLEDSDGTDETLVLRRDGTEER
jgi:hypothetical protein